MVAFSYPFKPVFLQFLLLYRLCGGQQARVVLEQGALVGLKVFPESTRIAVYAFLGIPYAQPPIGELRFAPPRPHTGWNWTLQATHMKPICPQPPNSVYDETADSNVAGNLAPDMEEDCLYLNVWVPEVGMRFGNLPVLVIITGEEMTFDWPRNRPIGMDFATENVVVFTLQYRSNIFGWISLGNEELAGNYGLQDQQLALHWIQHNVQHFGGNPRQVTILGHGTSGMPCVLAHMLSSVQSPVEATTFSKVILLSGGDAESVLRANAATFEASRLLVRKLGCQYEVPAGKVVKCLRSKSTSDLQKAFESIYDHGNGSMKLGLVVKSELLHMLTNRTLTQHLPPIMVGICSNEGAFMQDYWLDLAREGYNALSGYVNDTFLPNALRKVATPSGSSFAQMVGAVGWKYFGGEASMSASSLLNVMQRLISELYYETPFYQLLEHLTVSNNSDANSIYAYVFEVTNAMDLRGKVNLFGGASHSSDLPLLLGPSLFQQIARRRFTVAEERTCRKMRTVVANFVKNGNPTPGSISDVWFPYTSASRFIFNLGESVRKNYDMAASATFEQNLPQIEKLLEKENPVFIGVSRPNRNDHKKSYQAASAEPNFQHTKSSTASSNQLDTSYFLHLKQVYGFWHLLLPNVGVEDGIPRDGLGQRVRLLEASADAQRYRQGFFALLGLTCALLAVLGLCVYLLRRNSLSLSNSWQGYRL